MNVTDIDWASVKWEFENVKCSLRVLANKYKTYPMNISRKARDESWVKFDPVTQALENRVATTPNPQGMLDTIAVRKIQEIITELGDNYSPVDEPMVVMYGKTYQEYLKLASLVDKEGDVLYSPKTGAAYTNPRFNNLQAIQNNLTKLGDRLGLSISSRKKIGLTFKKEEKTQSLFNLVDDLSQGDDLDV